MTEKLFQAKNISDFFRDNPRRGQEILPCLIERLVQESVPQATVSFPSGDHISKRGYDGEVTNPILDLLDVPHGKSVWELGMNQQAKDKFKSDIEKRTNNPLGYTKSETVYCFVTPHKFANIEDEIAKNSYAKEWKKVKIYDADLLKGWLAKCSKTELWFLGKIGKLPHDIERLQDFYNRYGAISASQTADQRTILPPRLLLAGRKENLDHFTAWLGQKSPDGRHFGPSIQRNNYYILEGETTAEAAAFLYASLSLSEHFSLAINSLVVTSKKAAEEIARKDSSAGKNLLLIITAHDVEEATIQTLANKGWKTVWAVDSRNKISKDKQRLALPWRHALSETLQKSFPKEAGRNHRWANALATQSGRSINRLLAILRHDLTQKEEDEKLENLLPAILAGNFISTCSTGDKYKDREILEKLADGKEWPILERIFLKENSDHHLDGKIIKIGERSSQISWHLHAPQAEITALAPLFTERDGENFKQVCLEVLSTPHAGNYSPYLHKGLACSLAIMGSLSEDVPHSEEMRSWAVEIAREIFTRNNENSEWWQHSGDILSLLAEASPEAFLDNLSQLLRKNPQFTASLKEKNHHILWALGMLAWLPSYFSQIVDLLVLINTHFDTKSSFRYSSPNPKEALVNIFRPDLPQTSVSLEARQNVLQKILKNHSDIGWDLLLSTLPTHLGIILFPSSAPQWRNLEGEKNVIRLPHDKCYDPNWGKAVLFAAQKLVELAEAEPKKRDQRWAELLEKWEDLFPHKNPCCFLEKWRLQTLAILKERLEKEGDQMPILRRTLYKILAKPRLFSKDGALESEKDRADWALSEENLQTLKNLRPLLLPKTTQEKFLWAFEREVPFYPMDGLQNKHVTESLRTEQQEAVSEMLKNDPTQEIIALCQNIKFPIDLGRCLAELNTAQARQILGILLNQEGQLGDNINCGLYQSNPKMEENQQYCYELWQEAIEKNWGNLAEIRLLTRQTPTLELWQEIDRRPEEVQKAYWQNVYLSYWNDLPAEEVFRRFEKAKRPKAIFDWLSVNKHYFDRVKDKQKIVEILEQLVPEMDQFRNNDSYYLGNFLSWLAGAIPREKLAELELKFYPALRYGHLGIRYLFEELAEKPDLFVQFILAAYLNETDCQTPEQKEIAIQQRSKQESDFELYAAQILFDWTGFRLNPSRDYKSFENELSGQISNRAYLCFPGWRYGKFDAGKLRSWIIEVRKQLKGSGREKASDLKIGELIGQMAIFKEEISFPKGIAEILEDLGSEDLYRDLRRSLHNRRGVFQKTLFEGGMQERNLSEIYLKGATRYEDFPKLSEILKQIGRSYATEAKREDETANRRDLMGIFTF